jgi:hypothetical protein
VFLQHIPDAVVHHGELDKISKDHSAETDWAS